MQLDGLDVFGQIYDSCYNYKNNTKQKSIRIYSRTKTQDLRKENSMKLITNISDISNLIFGKVEDLFISKVFVIILS